MVARTAGGREVVGSNPASPTKTNVKVYSVKYEKELDRVRAALDHEISKLSKESPEVSTVGINNGKFIRSQILFGLTDPDNLKMAIKLATALELAHLSTLVHDDIIDDSKERRGGPSVYNAVGAERAIYVGNILAIRAGVIAMEVSVPCGLLLQQALIDTSRGQLIEFRNRGVKNWSSEAYRQATIYKTGAMLLLAIQFGLVGELVPLSGEAQKLLYTCVSSIAMAFQIIDDTEEVLLVQSKLNNSVPFQQAIEGTDLANGDFNYPLLREYLDSGQEDVPMEVLLRNLWASKRKEAIDTTVRELIATANQARQSLVSTNAITSVHSKVLERILLKVGDAHEAADLTLLVSD